MRRWLRWVSRPRTSWPWRISSAPGATENGTPAARPSGAPIRSLIIKTVARTGGHLASNLGTVELTAPLGHIPRVGPRVAELARRAEEMAKGLVTPGVLFEELGFTYVGPIHGHNLDHLTIEEHALAGGFGSAVLELLEESGLARVQVKRLGIPDLVVEQGAPAALRARFGLTAEGIQAAAEALVKVRRFDLRRGEGVA